MERAISTLKKVLIILLIMTCNIAPETGFLELLFQGVLHSSPNPNRPKTQFDANKSSSGTIWGFNDYGWKSGTLNGPKGRGPRPWPRVNENSLEGPQAKLVFDKCHDDYGFPNQFRVSLLLNGREKCMHIDVKDSSHLSNFNIRRQTSTFVVNRYSLPISP